MLSDVDPERDPEGPRPARDLDVAAPETGPATSRLRLGWRVVVPLVTAAAGLMFALSFRAAQGEDLRADRDLPSLIMAGDSRNEAKAKEYDVLLHEVEALTRANEPKDARLETLNRQSERVAAAA